MFLTDPFEKPSTQEKERSVLDDMGKWPVAILGRSHTRKEGKLSRYSSLSRGL